MSSEEWRETATADVADQRVGTRGMAARGVGTRGAVSRGVGTSGVAAQGVISRGVAARRPVRSDAWRALAAGVIALWSFATPVFAQPYEPQGAAVPAPPLDVDLAANVLVTTDSIVTIEAVGMPWQGNLPAYKLDQTVVTIVAPSTIQWSSPLLDAASFGPIWEGTVVEVSYVNRERAYLLNCATGNYAWVDLSYLRQANAGSAPSTCAAYRARQIELAAEVGGATGDVGP